MLGLITIYAPPNPIINITKLLVVIFSFWINLENNKIKNGVVIKTDVNTFNGTCLIELKTMIGIGIKIKPRKSGMV